MKVANFLTLFGKSTLLLVLTLYLTISGKESYQLNPVQAESVYRGWGRASVNDDLLKRYAPPPLEPQLAAQIEAMLDLRSPGAGIISPDGQQLFFHWSITGVNQVWRLDGPQTFPIQMTGGANRTFVVGISPNGKFLLLSRDRQGDEQPGLYVQDVDGGKLRLIYHQSQIRTIPLYISEDSRYIYFAANDRRADSFSIYRYDLVKDKQKLIFDRPGLWYIADVRKEGQFLLLKKIGNFAREYYQFQEANQKLQPLLGQGKNQDYRAQYGAKEGELLVLTPEFGEFRRLYCFSQGKFIPLTPELGMDVENFTIDRERQRIIYTLNNQGSRQLKALDAETFEPLKLPKFDQALQVELGTVSRNGRFLTLSVDTGKTLPQRYVWDWRGRKLRQWTLPSAPEIDTSNSITPVLESYPARDGTPIPMWVWRSSRCQQPCPVIVHFHGGPESQSRPGFNLWAKLFVEAGFTYVKPNVRGSSGYGKSWLEADNGSQRLEIITDIEDCARYLRQNWQVNGRVPKLGIMGGSYGGYSTLMGMTKFAGSYDAGVSFVGISNLVTFLENTAPYRRQVRIQEYGDPVKDREALLKLSPITYLDRVAAPLLLIQGANDPRVPVGEAIQMQQALEQRQMKSQLIIFSDEGHGTSKRSNRVLRLGHTLDFFRRHLQ